MCESKSAYVFCRICNFPQMESLLNFGKISLTGVFLRPEESTKREPLELVRCMHCGLVQLGNSYDLTLLYGDSYGYESHLNKSMKNHLQNTARNLEKKYLSEKTNQRVVDIASNDGTMLCGYEGSNLELVGIDPLINTVSDLYPAKARKIVDFFSADAYFSQIVEQASLVTSLSVLYDLENPIEFARDINSILIEDGIWYFEQSYLPTMVNTTGYDTVCHEHLLYLTLNDIQTILKAAGFRIIEVSLNEINGGSIAVTAKKTTTEIELPPFAKYLLKSEMRDGYKEGTALREFAKRSEQHRFDLKELLEDYLNQGYSIYGLGASTKGNVILQWLELTSKEINSIGEVNPKKFGRITPGSSIPIVSEDSLLNSLGSKSLMLVLPWHFRSGIVKNTEKYRANGGLLLFPLPAIEVVN